MTPAEIEKGVADMRKVLPSIVEAIEATERKATVERIPAAIEEAWDWRGTTPIDLAERVIAILDAKEPS